MAKSPYCKSCGSDSHYTAFCFQTPRKRIEVKKPIRIKPPIIKRAITSMKKKKVSAQSKSIRKRMVREADRVYSIHIRKKDAINGYARCVTCGHRDKWQLLENGHYISRRYVQIRWDDMNCHVQCRRCNQTLKGNLTEYKKYLIRKYGYDITEMLKRRVVTRGKVSTSDIQEIIKKYS